MRQGMRRRLADEACYGLAAILAVFYCIILWNVIHPKVSQEYRMYYIDQTMDKWTGNGNLHVSMGKTVNMEDGSLNNHLQNVWVEGSDGYMQSAQNSTLIFCLSEEPESDLLLTFLAGTGDRLSGNTIYVYMEDTFLGQCVLFCSRRIRNMLLPCLRSF